MTLLADSATHYGDAATHCGDAAPSVLLLMRVSP